MAAEPSIPADASAAEADYVRASRLAARGRVEEAKAAYLAALAKDPTHFGALNDFGSLLYAADYRSAARLVYAEAVKHHPDNAMGRINLANALLADGQIAAARGHYEAALQLAPDHPDACQGLANLLQDEGDAEAAEHYRRRSYRRRQIAALPFRGAGAPCRVLLLASAAGGNVPTRFLLDESLFATFVLAVEADAATGPLPEHDLVFNAVGDPDLAPGAVEAATAVAARSRAPLINPPARVRETGRAAIARRLAGIPGLRTPRVETAAREALSREAERFGFPLLLRSPGYHTGRNFVRVETAAELDAAAGALPGRELLLIEPLDARDRQGRWRKYRVMMIGGALHPLHLAVSRDWKVHYFTADMADAPAHRAEDEAFLADMAGTLGPRAMAALGAAAERLGLDYGGIDFGLGPEGEVLLFEANATMVVNPPDPDPRFVYRRAPTQRILAAAKAMLLERAGFTVER
ncbi:MAG: tetratricopeptide repeat protein [Caulobacteraceae bacterium]|nr:tetratricopeptide repeat protein [Caulobacteraceae bacterium]